MQIYKVGGAVRDELMGLKPKDVDWVVVGATPEQMLAEGYKQVGADFPVFLDDRGNEFALARTERKSGRGYNGFVTNHSPDVTLEQDLERRDLTINAMAIDPYGGGWLVDPFNGQDDLDNKVLRHVSPAFADDPVRVLRLARFHARYGRSWTVAPETMEFCREMVAKGELGFLTRERVLMELVKALGERDPAMFFQTLKEAGAFEVVFPEFKDDFTPITALMTVYRSRSYTLNYALMLHGVRNRNRDAFEARLKPSNDLKVTARLFTDAYDWLLEPTDEVDAIYKLDLFRKKRLWKALVSEMHVCGETAFDALDAAFDAIEHVGFDDIPRVFRETAKGKEISEQIKRTRKDVLKKAKATW